MNQSTVRFEQNVPVSDHYDVLVVGGGPAGIAAATIAARSGARVALVERYGILGGNLTVGHVGPICGSVGPGTIYDEIRERLGIGRVNKKHHDVETAKAYLAELVADAGVRVFLELSAVDTIVENTSDDARRAVRGAVVATKSGFEAFTSAVVVDATGDGDIAAWAGAEFEMGRPEDGLMQPATIMFTVSGVADDALLCGGEHSQVLLGNERFVDFCKKKNAAGELPPYVSVVRLYACVQAGEVTVNASQVNFVNGLLPAEVATADRELRSQTDRIIEFLRKYVPGYQSCVLKDSAETLGIRETRRILGDHVLSESDLLEGRRWPDAVVHDADFVIDIHNPTGGGQADGLARKVKPYEIPYGCFLPSRLENILVTGRCISGSHRAFASYRVMSICLGMGHAVGVAAALSAERRCTPRELGADAVRTALKAQGVYGFSS